MRPPVSKTRQFFADCQNFANLQKSRSAASEASKFWESKQFCFFLTIKLSVFFKHAWIKLQREKLLCSASARYSTYDGWTIFFLGPSDPSFYGFYNGNEEYERQFFRNAFDSYPGYGLWLVYDDLTDVIIVPLILCTSVPVFHCACAPLCLRSSVPLFLCASVSLILCASYSLFLCASVPVPLFLCAPVPLVH